MPHPPLPADSPRHANPVGSDDSSLPPVIDLSKAPGAGESWDRPKWVVAAWYFAEWALVTNHLQISSAVRAKTLKAFGAEIGEGVILRPGLKVRFPWKLRVGDRSWIGEDVWIHNQDQVEIGHDVVVSQGSFLTTGSHAHRRDMALITSPIRIAAGAWVTARSIVTGGRTIGRNALVAPGSVVIEDVPSSTIVRGNPAVAVGERVVAPLPGHEAPAEEGTAHAG